MSSYYPSFNYMGFNSLKDKHLVVTAFDADQGEVDTFLGMDPIYTENSDGTRRIDYGAKHNSVAVVKISVIKSNRKDFTVAEVRDFLRWTTGVKQNSYLDFLIGDEIKFSFLGRVTNAYQQKLDARTIGLSIEFTSVSPWAYSPLQTLGCSIGQDLSINTNGILSKGQGLSLLNVDNGVLYNGTDGGAGLFQVTDSGVVYIDNSVKLRIDNKTDDLYSYIILDTVFYNINSNNVSIKNITLNEETTISNMSKNEIIQLSSGQFIISDITNKLFGDTFNFVWPRLSPGINEFLVSGDGMGSIEFTYRYPMKVGDCAIDVYVSGDSCDCGDNTSYGSVAWKDIVDTPNTIEGYGIRDAYTITEIDQKINNNLDVNIDEQALDNMLNNVLGV